MADCLDGLVGLSQDDCDCFETGRPVDYNSSESGFFLTDPEYGFPMVEALDTSGDCAGYGVWDILTNSRDQAILQFRTDFLAKIRERYNRRVRTWKGTIGKLTHKTTSTGLRTYAGHVYRPESLKDGKLVITAAWLGLTTTEASVTLNVESNDPTFTAITKTLSSTAGQFNQNAFAAGQEITLPFYSDKVDTLEYYLYFTTAGLVPLQNNFYCCGGPGEYSKHLRHGGFTNDIINDETVSMGANVGYGLSFDGYFACNELEWLCDLDALAGYEVKSVIARAIQANGAAIAASEVISSSRVNKYTTWDSETITGRYTGLKESYNGYLTWLVENFPQQASDCFQCKSATRYQKRQILV